jgi:hypothetical protein
LEGLLVVREGGSSSSSSSNRSSNRSSSRGRRRGRAVGEAGGGAGLAASFDRSQGLLSGQGSHQRRATAVQLTWGGAGGDAEGAAGPGMTLRLRRTASAAIRTAASSLEARPLSASEEAAALGEGQALRQHRPASAQAVALDWGLPPATALHPEISAPPKAVAEPQHLPPLPFGNAAGARGSSYTRVAPSPAQAPVVAAAAPEDTSAAHPRATMPASSLPQPAGTRLPRLPAVPAAAAAAELSGAGANVGLTGRPSLNSLWNRRR